MSGNRVTTSRWVIAARSVIEFPARRQASVGWAHAEDHAADKRDQPFLFTFEHQNIVGAGFHHLRHATKTLAAPVKHFHSEKVAPVILALPVLGQQAARYRNLGALERHRRFTAGAAFK